MSRRREFQLSASVWLARTNVAKAKKGAVCPSDPPSKWEGAVVQWLLLITTKQLQTHMARAKGPSHTGRPGDKPYSVRRPRQPTTLPTVHSHATRPRCSPALLLLPHQVLQLKLQGGRGIMSVIWPHWQWNVMVPVQLAGTLGRKVCLLRSMLTMTAAKMWSKAVRKIGESCNFQTATGQ